MCAEEGREKQVKRRTVNVECEIISLQNIFLSVHGSPLKWKLTNTAEIPTIGVHFLRKL